MQDLAALPAPDGLASDEYQIFALCYAKNSARRVPDAFSFTGRDFHDGPMPIDYFIWIVRNSQRCFLIDLGFSVASAKARGRRLVHDPVTALRRIGIAPEEVTDIVISHMHVDHAGNIEQFPSATVHVQDSEVGYVTGRCMHEDALRHPYELDDVLNLMRKNWSKQLAFHDGDDALFAGVSLHLVPGHTPGMQATLVTTPRGKVLLASDGSHYFPNIYNLAPHRITVDQIQTVASYRRMMKLVSGPEFFIPGHDPKIRAIYPAIRVGGVELTMLHEPPSETALEFFQSVTNYAEDYPLSGE
jgi:glyoxylase-like metal-dependent hydrolase (beta-lactamase superfamily II)|tara:strand:+ start:34002 stop:34904 length:903 start_codon:yes stop_codon:yes gene_type:complete